MVVPKRAALLLDRLMVALHHALEKEHSGSARLREFYNNTNRNYMGTGVTDRNKNEDNDISVEDSRGVIFLDLKIYKFIYNIFIITLYICVMFVNTQYLAMYSDDDPTVMMNYDFKDLNSINRAAGETLMAESFQRRANMGLDLGGDMGVEGVSSLLDASSSSALSRGLLNGDIGFSGVGVVVGDGGGRTASSYWRCYFNAVTCF
ncbi:allatostatin double C isoform 1-T6 [Cochliomyia hominivorax]